MFLNSKGLFVFMIPYYKQEKVWTCGAAVLRMALASFGIYKNEKQVVQLLGTNNKIGTANRNFPRFAEKNKFTYAVGRNSSFADLQLFLRNGYRVIVCYYSLKEKSGHFAVVKKINSQRIFLLDPSTGENISYLLANFYSLWGKIDLRLRDGQKRWFFALKK